jgi:hypothetical protein
MENARKDLTEIYAALHQPDKAKELEAEVR